MYCQYFSRTWKKYKKIFKNLSFVIHIKHMEIRLYNLVLSIETMVIALSSRLRGSGFKFIESQRLFWLISFHNVALAHLLIINFWNSVTHSNISSLIIYQISLIDRVDKIYKNTSWRDAGDKGDFSDMGFVIKKILVHQEWSPVTTNQVHYNMDRTSWDVRNLLEVRYLT